jgi:hypothetical protein
MVVSALAFAMPAFAQTPDEPTIHAPAHIAYLDGDAALARDGRAEQATINMPLITGDRLRTDKGRAEVIYGDGSVLDIDHFTSVDFLSDDLIRLLEGRVRLTVNGRDRVSYRIDTPSGAVRIEWPGEYRVALVGEGGARDVELVAIRGQATLVNDLGETEVRAGERAMATAGMAPSYAQGYNSARWDAFDEWVNWRRDERMGTTSARYLPDDIHGYAGDFDRYGDWRYEHEYGYVWYPRVQVGWRPYYHGHWNWFGPWGWTWISYDRWGWPTHHYGRWGFRAGSWFWVPRRHWGPAYVYWASAPGYVGWCPLGWNNRPLFSIINVVNVRRGYDPYHAWTVIPRRSFGVRTGVPRYAVPRGTLRTAVPRWSVESATAPIRPTVQARGAAPIYTAGRTFARTRGATGETSEAGARGAVTTVPRGSVTGGERAIRRSSPAAVSSAPRRTAPAGPGSLGDRDSGSDRRVNRAVPRYRDLGPGGPTTAPPDRSNTVRSPGAIGSPETSRAPSRTRTPDRSPAPETMRTPLPGERGTPARRPGEIDRSPDYAPSSPRYEPRTRRDSGDRGAPAYSPPSRGYSSPERRAPDGGAARRGGDGSGGAVRSAPERRYSPPSGAGARDPGRGRAPSAGPSGGSRSPSRAVPRSGGSPSSGSRSGSRPSSGSGDSSRARPRPRPQ